MRGIWHAFLRMPRLVVFVFFHNLLSTIDNDPLINTVWSKVECSVGLPCPRGSYEASGHCIPYPRGDPNWSFSAHCVDKDVVQGSAAKVLGASSFSAGAMALVVNAFAGPAVDTIGCKPVLLLAFLSTCLFCALMCIACLLSWTSFVSLVYLAIIVGTVRWAEPIAAKAMCSGLSQGNPQALSEGFAAIGVAGSVASVIGVAIGVPVLELNLTDYAWMWAAFTLASVLLLIASMIILRETVVSRRSSSTCREACSVFADIGNQVRLGFRDPFLWQFAVINAIAWAGFSSTMGQSVSYLTNYLNYSQALASLTGVPCTLGISFGTAVSPSFLTHCTLNQVFGAGLAVLSVGFTMCGMGGLFPHVAKPLYWVGVSLAGFGFGVFQPPLQAILSMRAPPGSQGTVFSAAQVVCTIATSMTGFLWGDVFFQAGSVGWRAGLPFFAGAVATMLALVWFAALCLVQRSENAPGGRVVSPDVDGGTLDDRSPGLAIEAGDALPKLLLHDAEQPDDKCIRRLPDFNPYP